MSVRDLFVLLIIFQIKHFLADFPLQVPYMLKKFRPGWDFILPLTTHCLVHGFMTLIITVYYLPELWWLSVVDFVAHFVMDRIKAGPKYLGRYKDMTKAPFWVTFGFDQMFHHLTGLYVIWKILELKGLA